MTIEKMVPAEILTPRLNSTSDAVEAGRDVVVAHEKKGDAVIDFLESTAVITELHIEKLAMQRGVAAERLAGLKQLIKKSIEKSLYALGTAAVVAGGLSTSASTPEFEHPAVAATSPAEDLSHLSEKEIYARQDAIHDRVVSNADGTIDEESLAAMIAQLKPLEAELRRRQDSQLRVERPYAYTPAPPEMSAAESRIDMIRAGLLGDFGAQAEYIKAYRKLIGFDESDLSEKHLSPAGLQVARELAQNAIVGHWETTPYTESGQEGYRRPVAPMWDKKEANTHLGDLVIGSLAPGSVRKVEIDGVPYYQILDLYDFDRADQAKHKDFAKLVTDLKDLHKLDIQKLEEIAGYFGLQQGVNILIPVDSERVAPDDVVEQYRRQSRLPIKNQSFGAMLARILSSAEERRTKPLL